MPNTFKTLCTTLQHIRETRSTNAKIAVCAQYFSSLENDRDLNLAARFIGEGAFAAAGGKRVSVGSRTSGLAAAKFCGIDYDKVFKPCRTAAGSSSETIALLMANIPEARQKREPKPVALQETERNFERLRKASSRADKELLLWKYWQRMTPVEIKYFIRMLGRESLRIGFETRSVIPAIAEAFGQAPEDVRHAHMMTGSLGEAAVLAKNDMLDEARFRLFHPVSFMLGSSLEWRDQKLVSHDDRLEKKAQLSNLPFIESHFVPDLKQYIAEEKFDGMRAQIHTDGNEIRIFSRDLNDVTRSFPDIVSFFRNKNLPPVVLDGEICLCKDDMILPFQRLQKRLGIKKPGKKILESHPVLFIAFDLLFSGGKPVFDLSLEERRRLLRALAGEYNIPVTSRFEINSEDELNRLFERALKHGNEGLILKRKDSPYEYGKRGNAWLKVKKPGGSLVTVIMYAHAGSGKHEGLYSHFTLGISVKEDERYEEEFIPIGKTHTGYSTDELKWMNGEIRELTAERYGPTLGLLPRLVVEVEFDDIRENRRTKAGYTLHRPRFKAIRKDPGPEDVDTLKAVEKTYREKLNRKKIPQGENPSFRFQ